MTRNRPTGEEKIDYNRRREVLSHLTSYLNLYARWIQQLRRQGCSSAGGNVGANIASSASQLAEATCKGSLVTVADWVTIGGKRQTCAMVTVPPQQASALDDELVQSLVGHVVHSRLSGGQRSRSRSSRHRRNVQKQGCIDGKIVYYHDIGKILL